MVLLEVVPQPQLAWWRLQVARGVVGAVVVGHYPLNHHPARLAVEHLELFAFGWPSISVAFSSFQSLLFILSSLAVAVVVTDLGDVLHLVSLVSCPWRPTQTCRS